ncbi:efflux RND transporter periplasmic adaptor subunit [Dinghuibacter silviterrae]|uniref:Cu(I)/Ag(I) efflux system membrane fusion protein n=1 Tax=Dinghuibacter silviterrae TaxID=1539049 RepID=A0A4V3GLC6_9BACT|nr:efflux RND transporter periplasmic adaptor subunit [Dinghuibacter silviterrae]TDW99072.1 Cu(I)/Ag(I) efflux system membrane fusion protein [Dinghuibacter silviterrae]
MRYIIVLTAAALLFGACREVKKEAVVVHSDTVYTCSMHPQIMQDRPGKCPICGMELIPVKKSMDMGDGSVQLSDQQMRLGGVRLDTVGGSVIGDGMVLTGTVTVNETGSTAVSARLAGRIERLYVKTTGEAVHKGQKLYDLYSEELNNAEQEYLLALERQETLHSNVVDLKQLMEAARSKLLLWGLSEAQVAELARVRKPEPVTSFYSPSEGVVTSVEGHEGDEVAAGTVVVRLVDLSTVWVEAQVYTSQLPDIGKEAPVVVRLPEVPGREWPGRISFMNPEVDPDARINGVRIVLRNGDGVLKPGMAAEVRVTNGERHSLTLPETAVIRGATGNLVWVAAGHNLFRPVMVDTGVEEGDRVEIRSGLTAGDVVVTEGAYWVNSAYGFMHGGDAMAGMKM